MSARERRGSPPLEAVGQEISSRAYREQCDVMQKQQARSKKIRCERGRGTPSGKRSLGPALDADNERLLHGSIALVALVVLDLKGAARSDVAQVQALRLGHGVEAVPRERNAAPAVLLRTPRERRFKIVAAARERASGLVRRGRQKREEEEGRTG